ncbi:MAG: acyl-CoA thioesterase [Desulfobacter sp.]|nr:MAG: acyl-CoA thioesterase [Desulfobacter sp.]
MVKKVTREPVSEARIRFQDCDPFGHLNNARYLDYFINAREDHLADCYSLDIYQRQQRCKTNWVVAKTKIAYLHPAVLRERISICTRLIAYTHKSLLMEGEMTGMASGDLKAVAWIKFRHFDLAGRQPARHSGDLMELFESIIFPAPVHKGFDARVRQVYRG